MNTTVIFRFALCAMGALCIGIASAQNRTDPEPVIPGPVTPIAKLNGAASVTAGAALTMSTATTTAVTTPRLVPIDPPCADDS